MDSQLDEIQIFTDAIAIADSAARSVFLSQICDDNLPLRERLERLISAHLKSVSVLDEFSLNSTSWEIKNKDLGRPSEGAVEPGTVIAGRYTLIERIGQGGMGEVWVAQQMEPVKRKVAIKLIHAGMDTRQVLGRFEAERQALALMEHPNIARIYDGGVTASGRPFFAMELVKGIMVTEYCDQCQLTVRERLSLFGQICSAVQHAHQKGLIHRDLKPSNILVSEFDGNPICKVIDFGLAKAVQGMQSLTEISMQTAFGAVIGTPMYMAPEQLRVSQQDIDTRADLYSLGVILYELLTGSTPIERDRLKKAAWDEVLKMIREEDPPTPSQRLSNSDSLPSVAARRHIEPLRLTKLVKGELDWIIMKALDKNRNRRYESASGFGLDIQRYLAGESVLAAPPSRIYNARKFITRNRGLVSIGMLLFLTLLAGIIGTSYGLYNARLSATAETQAKTDALNKRTEAEQQRNRAEAREQQAINAVKKFGDAVRNNPELKSNPELGELRKTLLLEPLGFFRTLRSDLEKESSEQSEALEKLAAIAFDLGLLAQEIGSNDDALEAHQQSLSIRDRLLDLGISNIGLRYDTSTSHIQIALIYVAMGQRQKALKQNQIAADLLEQIIKETPEDQNVLRDFGGLQSNIGNIYDDNGDTENASKAYKMAIEIAEQLIEAAPSNDEYRADSIKYRYNFAAVLADLGNYDQALDESETCMLQVEKLLEATPDSDNYRLLLALILKGRGIWLSESKSIEDAMPTYLRQVEVNEELTKKRPTNQAYQRQLAGCYFSIGMAYELLSKPGRAMGFFENSVEISEKLVRENSKVLDNQIILAKAFKKRGEMYLRTGNPEGAKADYERALKIRENVVQLSPETNFYQIELALSYLAIGKLLATSDKDAALEAFSKSIANLDKLTQDHPNFADNYRWHAVALDEMAEFEMDCLQLDSAREHLLRGEAQIGIALKTSPKADSFLSSLKFIYLSMIRLGNSELTPRAKKGLVEIAKNSSGAAKFESKINEVLTNGSKTPASELIAIAGYGYDTLRYGLASRVYGFAIDEFPEITRDRQSQVRYNAACCAALAAAGSSYDESFDDLTKGQLRGQAIAWLRAELVDWKTHLGTSKIEVQRDVIAVLDHWKKDPDLASLRDAVHLEKLVASEQQACHSLWNEVAELLQIASQTKSPDIEKK